MATKVFLPLRSNTSWFSEDDAVRRFERLLKVHVALFDELVLEDGAYSIFAAADGQGMAQPLPPGWCKDYDRSEFRYYQPGGRFGIQVGDKTLLSAELSFGCTADFKPILLRAGLEEATYFQWHVGDINQILQQEVNQQADRDLLDNELVGDLPLQKFFRKELLRGFYRDAFLAQLLRMPLAIDHHLSKFVHRKKVKVSGPEPAPELMIYDHWVELGLPDFSEYSWQEIHELHDSEVGNDFRRMIERISMQVREVISAGGAADEIRHLVGKMFSIELVNEVRLRRSNLGTLGVDVLLSLVPYGSLLSGIRSAADSGRDTTSWISLL
jgi:hypothetical protein